MTNQFWTELNDQQAQNVSGGGDYGLETLPKDTSPDSIVNPQGNIVATVQTAIVFTPNTPAENAKGKNAGPKFVDSTP